MQTPADPSAPEQGSGNDEQHGEQGVIHDIGYRRFTGTRLGRGPVRTALFWDTFRGSFGLGRSGKAKIMPFVLLAIAVLPALAVVLAVTVMGQKDMPVTYREYLSAITTLVYIFIAGQAPQAVSRDLRFRTISLYFSRPMPRVDYVLAKFGAMSCAVLVFCVAPLLVLYIGALLGKMSVGEQTADLAEGLVTALVFAVVLAGIGLLIAAVTPKRGFGVAAIITIILLADSVASAIIAIAHENGNDAVAWYGGLVSPFFLVDGALSWALDLDGGRLDKNAPPGSAAGLVFVLVLVAVLVGNYLLLNLRYRKVSVS